jgi:predicted dehydrogenase
MKTDQKIHRRKFLTRSAGISTAAIAAPYFVPASVLGAGDHVAPSNRITMGCIGNGERGKHVLTKELLENSKAQVLATCDVALWRRDEACDAVNEKQGNQDCTAYADFREVLARDDLDAVMISTPDHWHTPIAIAAARAGKDIYLEKPVSHTVAEGRALADAVRRYGRVFTTATINRSFPAARRAVELVRNGRIGKLQTIQVVLPSSKSIEERNEEIGIPKPEPIPDGFDYNLWLGPAPRVAYNGNRVFWMFRYCSDYSGGYMTDWGAHTLDLAQWGNGTQLTGPIEVEGQGYRPPEGLYDVHTRFHVTYTYANGVKVIVKDGDQHIRFEGTDGWVEFGTAPTDFDASSDDIKNSEIGPDEIHLYRSEDHTDNFLTCVQNRTETAAPMEVAHRSATMCHLGIIAMDVGKKLKWDPNAERFANSETANRMLSKSMRSPWTL